jgi:hypothetical protein
MRLTIVASALAAAALSFTFSPAFAAHNGSPGGSGGLIENHDTVAPDLGVNVTWAGQTRADVQRFLASLEPDTRRAVLEGCEHYLREPVQARQATTVPFCRLAL